jgi:hypothetical protein
MKIGIITIATGKYSIYVSGLISSCEQFFLNDHEKNYFIYSDYDDEYFKNFKGSEKITKIHQDKLGWPYDSMMRFHMFVKNEDILSDMDYLFFMNANMLVSSEIDESILPKDNLCGIVSTLHPGYYKSKSEFPYEENTKSEFYIPDGDGKYYFQGCFNGGRAKEFLGMSKELSNKMDTDLHNGIIPVWHDESALNWYLVNKDPHILPPTYAYPEKCDGKIMERILLEKNNPEDINLIIPDLLNARTPEHPFEYMISEISEPKIIQRNKNMDGGKVYLRK